MKFPGFVLAALIVVYPAAPRAETLLCQVRKHGPYFVIADKIVLDVDAKSKRVMVADGVLAHYGQMPTTGRLKRNTGSQMITTWTLQRVSATEHHDGLSENVHYKAILNRKTMNVSVSAWIDPVLTITGSGKCMETTLKDIRAKGAANINLIPKWKWTPETKEEEQARKEKCQSHSAPPATWNCYGE
ncbi:hypothetical protein [Shimia sediminis]|uniref:hypothetical protein n=1 Tax=Shimia sediminis TaxID=2497945 RepID=UPI000F8ED463|nr:hypothetical protein [Shimia sediminis]